LPEVAPDSPVILATASSEEVEENTLKAVVFSISLAWV
jgi:hypothetical protein